MIEEFKSNVLLLNKVYLTIFGLLTLTYVKNVMTSVVMIGIIENKIPF
jgi:hypothetical protein